MVYLAYDPGLNDAGIAIVRDSPGLSLMFSKHYTSQHSVKNKRTQESRMYEQFEILQSLCQEHKVDFIITERQFGGFMSGLETIPRLLAGKYSIPVCFSPPKSWIKKLTGSGNSNKIEIKEMVLKTINVIGLSEHEYDCIGMIIAEVNPIGNKEANVFRTKKNTKK